MTDIGPTDKNVIWDLSQVKVSSKAFTQRFIQYPGDLSKVVALEKGTQYYHLLRDDSIIYCGYENNQVKMVFDRPQIYMQFPYQYRDSIFGYFHGNGVYCDKQQMQCAGTYSLKADACGKIVLPNGDTLFNVVRLHTTRKISNIYYSSDSVSVRKDYFNSDVIQQYQCNDTSLTINDEYRWYAGGYRYPILEYHSVYQSSHPALKSNIAYYCPPEMQQTQLALDDENMKERNELAKNKGKTNGNVHQDDGFTYRFAQSSEKRNIQIHYESDRLVNVVGILSDMNGIVYRSSSQQGQMSGDLDLSYDGLKTGSYVMYVKVNEKIYTEKITINRF